MNNLQINNHFLNSSTYQPELIVPQDITLIHPVMGSIRDGFGKGLVAAAEANPQVVALCADLTESVRMKAFSEKFPERFVEVGVAEQNLVGLAAGLAAAGKIPFAASYATFSPGRSWEQTRVSVCYSDLNVKLVGGHAGLTVGPDGATHQALEDIALTRVLPNMTVVVPCDEHQAYQATLSLAQHLGPSYLRLSRIQSPQITTLKTPFILGKGQLLNEGSDVTILATGIMVAKALEAAHSLEKKRFSAQVINLHTIKPLDTAMISWAVKTTGAVVTAEEHQQAGGMGSAVAEFLAQSNPVPLEMVAVKDRFGQSGEAEELLEEYGLTAEDIVQAAQLALSRKIT